MLILAIDSATSVAAIALMDEKKVVKEEFVNLGKTHSETLLPMIDRTLKECACTLDDIAGFAVTTGPGSFTGLRIGLATVKGLGMAAGKPVIGISTLDVIAHNVAYTDSLVGVILDARKNEVYHAMYDVSSYYPQRITEIAASSPEDLVKEIIATAEVSHKNSCMLLGDGFYPYENFWCESLKNMLVKIPFPMMLPRAAALGSLAFRNLADNKCENAFSIMPDYIRLSEAETRLQKG